MLEDFVALMVWSMYRSWEPKGSQIGGGNMFTVYLKSAGGTKKYFTEFETEAEAESFCREYGWEYVDENEFVWDMDYEEV